MRLTRGPEASAGRSAPMVRGTEKSGLTGLREPLQVPVWQERQQRCMVSYRLIAGVFHIGDSVVAGHYRAFWPLQPRGVAVGDDFARPSVAGAPDLTRIYKGTYLCFLERAE